MMTKATIAYPYSIGKFVPRKPVCCCAVGLGEGEREGEGAAVGCRVGDGDGFELDEL